MNISFLVGVGKGSVGAISCSNTPMCCGVWNNSTLLHSFVIFPMRKIIFGVRGCFPASHGQEMKDLIASRGRRPREAVNVHFQPK